MNDEEDYNDAAIKRERRREINRRAAHKHKQKRVKIEIDLRR